MGKILTNRWKLSPTILLNKPEKKSPCYAGEALVLHGESAQPRCAARSSKSICARPNGTCEEAQLLLLRTWLHQTPPTNRWIQGEISGCHQERLDFTKKIGLCSQEIWISSRFHNDRISWDVFMGHLIFSFV